MEPKFTRQDQHVICDESGEVLYTLDCHLKLWDDKSNRLTLIVKNAEGEKIDRGEYINGRRDI